MQFRITIDDYTKLGKLLAELPERSRQARLIELATLGLVLDKPHSVVAFGEKEPSIEVVSSNTVSLPKPKSSIPDSEQALPQNEVGVIDFGEELLDM